MILLDHHGGKPSKNVKVYPFAIVLIAFALLLTGLFAGRQFVSDNHTQPHIAEQLQLEQRYNNLHNRLAEANATVELMVQESESLRGELLTQQEKNSAISNRLRMFESILEARKTTGVQLLSTELKWVGKERIKYHFTLVKGGNYPRRVTGSIVLTVQSPEGESIKIKLGREASKLPFRTETHTFLRGFAKWEHTWYPDSAIVTVSDRRGKEIVQMEVAIKGAP